MSSIDPLLLAMMTQTVVVENAALPSTETWTETTPQLDIYGRHDGQVATTDAEWQTGKTIKCRLEYSTKIVAGTDHRDRASSGRAYLDGFYPEISTESRITIPSQKQPALRHPVIVSIDNNYDETGLTGYNTVLNFE
jgi:hypothetical protein